jgi:hypothetical protein
MLLSPRFFLEQLSLIAPFFFLTVKSILSVNDVNINRQPYYRQLVLRQVDNEEVISYRTVTCDLKLCSARRLSYFVNFCHEGCSSIRCIFIKSDENISKAICILHQRRVKM